MPTTSSGVLVLTLVPWTWFCYDNFNESWAYFVLHRISSFVSSSLESSVGTRKRAEGNLQ